MADDGLRLALEGAWSGEEPMPVGLLAPRTEPVDLAALFPKAMTLFVSLRIDGERLRRMPAFLRDRLLPERLPGYIGKVLPPVADWVDSLEGDIAFGVLGVDERATVEVVARVVRKVDALLQQVHGALAFACRDLESAVYIVDSTRTRLEDKGGWTIDEVEASGYLGFTAGRNKPRRRWSVLRKDEVVLVLSGPGEVERFLAVAEERALPLQDVPRGTAAVHMGFTRITRELADKGIPPYFLKMINDIRTITLGLEARGEGVGLALDVAL